MGHLRHALSDIEAGNGRSRCQSWTGTITWCAISYTCILLIFVRVCFPDCSLFGLGLLPLLVHGSTPDFFYAFSKSPRHFSKPRGIEIVALVPFHEPSRTEILACYLSRNLAFSGGFLDRVVFMPQTNHTESLEWLSSMVDGTSSYSVSETSHLLYEMVDENVNTLFVWIDGDVVFLEDHTIATISRTKLEHPDSLIVSANVINEAALEHLHSHPSIALPYLPELQPAQSVDSNSWRASELSRWKGPTGFQARKGFEPPFTNHRWLPTDDENFGYTPVGMSIYSDHGPGSDEWTAKAQQHYSFLHHLDLGDLRRYKFPLWTNPADPISTSFFCFMGGDAKHILFAGALQNTVIRPSENGSRMTKDLIIDGKGVAVHYFSGHGSKGLEETDVLQRYRSYAREIVCPGTA
ncbi:hypothetical protein BDV10DRAFT_175987 [Aspergillus recurvatus]